MWRAEKKDANDFSVTNYPYKATNGFICSDHRTYESAIVHANKMNEREMYLTRCEARPSVCIRRADYDDGMQSLSLLAIQLVKAHNEDNVELHLVQSAMRSLLKVR